MTTHYGSGRMEPGRWASSGSFTGIIVHVDDDASVVTLYNPGNSQLMEAPQHLVTLREHAMARVRMEVMLPVPEGFSETEVRRWIVTLLDNELRIRAESSLATKGYATMMHDITPVLEIKHNQA